MHIEEFYIYIYMYIYDNGSFVLQGFDGGGLGRGGLTGMDEKVCGSAGVKASLGHKLADEPG
jgi:hypothetical protein